ncbi:hypothetical protein TNIN_135081 [Trichonephila inaurata madagascariensis]|uniref:Uncharacterized protein n=1 Tax=Trichonephila inaurata madagascariensis TaxID=2747483 RepID=A0A8X6Y127_9ARAC|nr:hypothetical protein TNIN_135081 [Trichonephila inaurata madagascariensis]
MKSYLIAVHENSQVLRVESDLSTKAVSLVWAHFDQVWEGSTKEWLLFCTRKGLAVESVFNRKVTPSRSSTDRGGPIICFDCKSACHLIKANGP